MLLGSRIWLVFCGLTLLMSFQAHAEKRVALVIGNSAYVHTSPLTNPRRDAELMAASLSRVGFAVTKLLDADQRTMKRALRDFGRALRGSDAVGLFYYAGHGVQTRGENFLIPVDADIADQSEVGFEAVNVNQFLQTMERAQSRINIVILDACRDNPFASGSRSASRGLARVSAPTGTFIGYATAPGAVAQDGKGANSPYAAALSQALVTPGLTIEQVFKTTRRKVLASTGGAQTPWDTSSITGEFYFSGKGGNPAAVPSVARPAPVRVQPAPVDNQAVEIAFWNSIKNSTSKQAFEAYLRQYPKGSFAALARLKLNELSRPAAPPPSPVQPGAAPLPAPRADPAPRQAHFDPARIFRDSSRRSLSSAALRGLSCHQLWVARNEIYDRNGYCFKTSKGRQYFDNSDCRSRQVRLSSLEKGNVSRIQSWERRKGCR